jgi:hypothetical protein
MGGENRKITIQTGISIKLCPIQKIPKAKKAGSVAQVERACLRDVRP